MTNLLIRPEKAEDFHNTELMTMRSFWNKYFPGCVEHNMLRVIRASADYLPQISRIAELDGKIVGGIYDDRFLVKPVPVAVALMPDAQKEMPYEGAKEMLLVDNVDNREFMCNLLRTMYDELPAPKK